MPEYTKDQIRSIKCTQCGAPINLLGDNKVLSITCPYCLTCLDAFDDYKIIEQFQMGRPSCPLKIGMMGTLKGTEFIIIGIVQFTESDAWGSYPWLEFLLFSKTHGYAWLCRENGHFVLVREVKDIPNRNISMTEPIKKTHFKVRDKTFTVFECSSASLTYVEGELTWIAQIGDRIQYLDAICPPYMYSVEQSKNEKEYSYGEYIEADEIHEAFGVKKKILKKGVFACEPFQVSPLFKGISIAGFIYAFLSLGILFYMNSTYAGTTLPYRYIDGLKNGTLGRSNPFTINNPRHLISMELSSPLRNAWAFYDVSILNDQDEEVHGFGKELSYYSGVEGGESWSEGTTRAHAYFKVPEAGNYSVVVQAEGGEGEFSYDMQQQPLYINIKEGCKVIRYFVIFFIAMFGFSVFPWIRKYSFERERWKDYYEEQEDDD